MAAAVPAGPPVVLASPNAGVFCSKCTILLSVESPGLSFWCQASISLHDSLNSGSSTTTENAFSPNGLCCPLKVPSFSSFCDLFMPSKRVSVGDSYIITFGCQKEVQSWLTLEHSFCMLPLGAHFPDFTSVILVPS